MGGLIDVDHLPCEYKASTSIKLSRAGAVSTEYSIEREVVAIEQLPEQGLHLSSFIEKLENSLIIKLLKERQTIRTKLLSFLA